MGHCFVNSGFSPFILQKTNIFFVLPSPPPRPITQILYDVMQFPGVMFLNLYVNITLIHHPRTWLKEVTWMSRMAGRMGGQQGSLGGRTRIIYQPSIITDQDTWHRPLASAGMWMWTCTCTRMHTCTRYEVLRWWLACLAGAFCCNWVPLVYAYVCACVCVHVCTWVHGPLYVHRKPVEFVRYPA